MSNHIYFIYEDDDELIEYDVNNSNSCLSEKSTKTIPQKCDGFNIISKTGGNNNINNNKKNTINKDFKIPQVCDLTREKLKLYKMTELVHICKHYNIKGYSKLNKSSLINVIVEFKMKVNYIIIIQKNVRRFIVQSFLNKKSPNKTWLPSKRCIVCKNNSDFYTLDSLENIPLCQYICYVDSNNCYWGFDMLSLYNYYTHQYNMSKSKYKLNNPYTGLLFDKVFIDNFLSHIDISNKMGFNVMLNTDNNNEENDISISGNASNLSLHNNQEHQRSSSLVLLDILCIMENHGYLIRMEWITNISKDRLIRFLHELYDIWVYRSQITIETQMQICHPHGNPFNCIYRIDDLSRETQEYVFSKTLNVILNMTSKGVTYADCGSGIIYVMSALSLVSIDVATAYPWIYEQSYYIN
jgi:hypothetical protein